jgi:hypothetical protein
VANTTLVIPGTPDVRPRTNVVMVLRGVNGANTTTIKPLNGESQRCVLAALEMKKLPKGSKWIETTQRELPAPHKHNPARGGHPTYSPKG